MNEKKPLIIASAVLAVIILAGGGALYYFHFVVMPKALKELEDAKKAVADAMDKKSKIKGYLEQIDVLKKDEEKKRSRIPNLDTKEYDGLANLLDDIRKRAGVDISGGRFSQAREAGPGVASPNVHKVQYDMNVKGAFHQLVRYLNLIEKEKRYLGVDSLTIGRGADASVRGRSVAQAMRDLKITLSSYTYRVPPTPPPVTVAEDKGGGQSTPVPD